MNSIEHLWIGVFGHICLISSFTFSLFASVAYYLNLRHKVASSNQYAFKKIANVFYVAHTIALLSAFGVLVYIILQHYFEYKYVWQHSSYALPFKYLLASVWEGQEGSFLLWALWHGVLGSLLIWRKRVLYAEALFFVSIVQVLLTSMLLGIYIMDIKIGSSPFILMKDFYADAPIFQQANYLDFIKDGNGLNELLQNYWMVIHPPILFLGFALCVFPFSYACVSLWKNENVQGLEQAQVWGLWASAILGLGIMMGGAWAYESLSFGGYWAWDPVENASLVPWMILIAALHSNIITRKKQKSYLITFILWGLSFSFVLYSTYLTRSGILGDTSVHSFTDLEMGVQLISLVVLSLIPFVYLLIKRWRILQHSNLGKEEDHITSREFWLSIGVLILFLSALYIIFSTSLPVINKIMNTSFSMGTDVEFAYNRVLIWSAIFILLLSFSALTLKFKKSDVSKDLKRKLFYPVLVYTILAILLAIWADFEYSKKGQMFQWFIGLAFIAGILSLCMHIHYAIFVSKKHLGTLLSHFGFALMLVGITLSSANKKVLSYNYSGFLQNFGEKSTENPLENITLIKGAGVQMSPYLVTYLGDSTAINDAQRFFVLQFEDVQTQEVFRLYPSAFVNIKGNQGLLSNPDKKHYVLKDVFVYVTSIPSPSNMDSSTEKEIIISAGDTTFLALGFFVIQKQKDTLYVNGMNKNLQLFDTSFIINPSNNSHSIFLHQLATNMEITANRNSHNKNTFTIRLEEKEQLAYVTLKAYLFPFINAVWLGVIILVLGGIIAAYERMKKST